MKKKFRSFLETHFRNIFCTFLKICILIPLNSKGIEALYEGDLCNIKNMTGICRNQDDCPKLEQAFRQGQIRNEEIPHCGYSRNKEIICCPIPDFESAQTSLKEKPTERASSRFCRNFRKTDQREENTLEIHVFHGDEVELNEYGFMASLGFKNSQDDFEMFKFNCGGTLIAEKFVLTAAHCVNDAKSQPNVVMLGSVALSSLEQSILIDIEKTRIHPDFHLSSTYIDIALIELSLSITFTQTIYPLCLYTEPFDPPSTAKLYVAGWGRTEKSAYSNLLLKAELNLVPLERCRRQIGYIAPNRHLKNGVQNTQICANGMERDACEGDSGGPLIMQTNQNKSYLVGIIAAGFSCSGPMPSLYTRVSSYLDFIESIVWPNNK